MMYRNHQEYQPQSKEYNLEILKSWLNGEAPNDSLKIWLYYLYKH